MLGRCLQGRYIGQATLQWVTSTTVTVTYQLLPRVFFKVGPWDRGSSIFFVSPKFFFTFILI